MLPRNDWKGLKFWQSGEWQVCEEELNDLDQRGVRYCPRRDQLFRALSLTPIARTKVAILGQDPYPNVVDATGVAFSVPKVRYPYPSTLRNILAEYYKDLHYPYVATGCLEDWCKRGVLLWNVYPLVYPGRPGSCHWTEWSYLTHEIVEVLHAKGTLLVSLGNIANQFIVNRDNTMHFSHPSPLGHNKGSNPFTGSRLFTTINDRLCQKDIEPIDWRLP